MHSAYSMCHNNILVCYDTYYNSTKMLIDEIKDPNDICYLATCLVTNAYGIWTHDPHFKEQKKVKIFTNIDMIRISSGEIN